MARVRGVVPLATALVLALLAIGLLGFSSTLNPVDALLGRGAVVPVPDVVDTPRPRAEAELTDAGLRVQVSTAFSLGTPEGVVVAQTPREGERVRTGTTVELVVSRGANRVEMPDAVGRPLSSVMPTFDEADIPVTVERVASEDVDRGVVIEQTPAAGVQVSGADPVAFTVSAGPADRPVPEVAGRSLDAASFELGRAGLVLGELTIVDDPGVAPSGVISSEPIAGTEVARDTEVDLVVSAGGPPVAVPDVVEDTEQQATAALEAAGFVVAVASRLVGVGGDGVGGVFEQYPDPGTQLRPGERVTIVVGREGPPLLPPRTTTTTTAPPRSTTTTTRPRR